MAPFFQKEMQIMKRILTAMLIGTVSMFFTGCSEGLIKGADIQTDQIMGDAASIADSETDGDMNIKMDYDEDPTVALEDYYDYNEEMKYEGLEGEPAFVIPEDQLEENSEIENFQVLDMVNENTFLYIYSVVTPSGGDQEKVIHCASIYNFRTKELKVIHKTESTRNVMTMTESFVGQWCRPGSGTGMGKLFIYDNGLGSIYDLNTLSGVPEFQTDVETLMRRYFTKPAAVSVGNAVSDGQYNIYVEMILEKTGTLSEDSEASDEELEEDLIQVVMAYEFIPLSENLHLRQDNESFSKQVEEWKAKTSGKVYETLPSETADWTQVLKEVPNKWTEAYIPELGSVGVKQWKVSPVYEYEQDGYVCTFQAKKDNNLQSLTNPPQNKELTNTLVTYKGYDYTLSAYVGSFSDYEPQTITRTVTLKTGTDEEGNDITETRVQSLRVYKKRQQTISSVLTGSDGKRHGAWMEGYRILKRGGDYVGSIHGEDSSQILCEINGKLCWMDTQKNYAESPISVGDEDTISIFRDGTQARLVKSDKEKMIIYEDLCKTQESASLTIALEDLSSRYKQGDGESEQEFQESFQEDLDGSIFSGVNVYTDSLSYTGENIQSVTVAGSASMDELRDEWGEDVLGLKSGTSANGYLFTSETQGISIYIPATKQSFTIDTGGWYRTWKTSGGYVTVGFSGEYALNGEDLAYARVVNLDVQAVLDEAVKQKLAAYEKEAAEEAEKEAEKASKEAENSHHLNMEEDWNESNSKKQSGS